LDQEARRLFPVTEDAEDVQTAWQKPPLGDLLELVAKP
jgi:hypothetical protein